MIQIVEQNMHYYNTCLITSVIINNNKSRNEFMYDLVIMSLVDEGM